MADVEQESGFYSLADLANMETDEIKTLMTRLPPAGIFVVLGLAVTAAETKPNAENPNPLFRFSFKSKVLEAKPISKDTDPESLVGRELNDSYTVWTKTKEDFIESIGLLKGKYTTVGLDTTGRMGGVTGQEPGWLDGYVNAQHRLRIRHVTNKDGQERAYFDWLPAEDANKSGE